MQQWEQECFKRAFDFLHKTHEVLHLCMQGLDFVSKHPGIHEALLATMDGESEERIRDEKRTLEACRKMAKSSQDEIDSGFATLHSQSIVALWGTLDALVEDLLTAWIRNEPKALQAREFQKIKVSVFEYEFFDEDQRAAFLVRELTRSLNADLKRGIGRFETLLAVVGLTGKIDKPFRRDLFELSQVRNILVHRAGIADEIFCSNCPWVGVKLGDAISMDHDVYIRYYKAVHVYMFDLMNRVELHQGGEPIQWSLEEWEKRGICGTKNHA